MKKVCTILTMCLLMTFFSTTDVEAQIVKGEAFMGLNLSQIDGDMAYGYKRFGLHAGLGGLVPVYKKDNFDIDFSMEIVFNQRGSHQRQQFKEDENGITGEYDVYMNYLEVPVLFYFSDRQIYSLGLGASYGRMIGLKEYEHGKLTDVNLSYKGEDRYSLHDFSVLFEGKIRLYERLKLAVRYQYSMLPIRTRDFDLVNGEPNMEWQDVKQYNNNITVRLIYVFNEDRSEYIYDEYEFHGDNPRVHQKAIDKQLKKLRKKQAKAEKKAAK
ncbi:MAG: PorT family protein [Lentimicrobiaceae bacterium]|nr:PorT family protein [Lentimicrobiaceae bacterium]